MKLSPVNTILVGLGAVNLGWLKILKAKRIEIESNYHLEFRIVAVADSSGVAINQAGWGADILIDLKTARGKARDLPGFLPGVKTEQIVDHVKADLLIESSPANLIDGQPGLSTVRSALSMGMCVVLANKTPLIFAFDELHGLAEKQTGKLAYSATVCGGLPVINVLRRDLKLVQVKRIRGIFNATSNFVLRELENGGSLPEAIIEAQRLGAAEADPSHDLHGHDTANKLFIIMKSFTSYSGTITDIHTEGIQQITPDMLTEARNRGNIIKLVAAAIPEGKGWKLTVAPLELPRNSFLGNCEGWEMGIEIETDLYEKICMKNYEADPLGTSAAVMRDCLELSTKL
jgi:homoserine dehydrogenase